jgi:hypothetical protein
MESNRMHDADAEGTQDGDNGLSLFGIEPVGHAPREEGDGEAGCFVRDERVRAGTEIHGR